MPLPEIVQNFSVSLSALFACDITLLVMSFLKLSFPSYSVFIFVYEKKFVTKSLPISYLVYVVVSSCCVFILAYIDDSAYKDK